MTHDNLQVLKALLEKEQLTQDDIRKLAKILEGLYVELSDPMQQIEAFLCGSESARYMREDIIADKMGMSSRNLRLILQRHNIDFVRLRDHVLKDRCERLMESGVTSASVLAKSLGYSNRTYFYRVFKRWMGVSFSEYMNCRKS